MEEPPNSATKKTRTIKSCFDVVYDDILQCILSRLPAVSLASAALVSKNWNSVCNERVLYRPKMASALSLNPSFEDAVREVLDKVLSGPIRPHFALAFVGRRFPLREVHELLKKRLGSKTPIITSMARGIIGTDAVSDEFREVKWTDYHRYESLETQNLPQNAFRGISLMVGFIPGLKVQGIPILGLREGPLGSIVDKFVMDIRDYTASVSGRTSPDAILFFSDEYEFSGLDMRAVLRKLDYAMSPETAIVGKFDVYCLFGDLPRFCDVVALIFVRDRNKPEGIGETHFHVMLATGLSPFGSAYKVVNMGSSNGLWLGARKDGVNDLLDGDMLITDIEKDELENGAPYDYIYMGFTKKSFCSLGFENPALVKSLEFHRITDYEGFFSVRGVGITTGDSFRFYHSDSSTIVSSNANVSKILRNLKQTAEGVAGRKDRKEVFGGFTFSCIRRGFLFFDSVNVDSSPFLENFPGVPLAGVFCGEEEIGRGGSCLIGQEGQEPSSSRHYRHAFSTVYLVMSYTPPLQGI